MLKRRLLVFAAVLVALGLALSWWAKRSPWLSERLRAPIQAALIRASGRPVALGGVGGGISGWIWLQDLAIGPDPQGKALDLSLTAKAVGLRFKWSSLLRGQVELSDLQALRVDDPKVYFIRRSVPMAMSPTAAEAGAWSALKGLPLPALPIDLRGGSVYEDAPGEPLKAWAEGVRLGLEPSQGRWRLRGGAELVDGGRLALWGDAAMDLGSPQMKARASAIPLGPLSKRLPLPAGLRLSAGHLGGEWDLRLEQGAWRGSGHGDLRGVTVERNGALLAGPLDSAWRDNDGVLSFSGLQGAFAGGDLRGGLQWADAGASGHFELRRARLEALAGLGGAPQALSLSGKADAELSVAGPLSACALSLQLRGTGARCMGRELSKLEMNAQAQGLSGNAQMDLAWSGGEGGIGLGFDAQGLALGDLRAHALPLAWMGAFAGLSGTGRVDATLRFRREAGALPWDLDLRSAQGSLGALALKGFSLQGSGDAGSARFRAEGELPPWAGLNASLDADAGADGVWLIRSMKLYERNQLRLSATGKARLGAAPSLDLKADKLALPMASLAPRLPPALAALSGTAQAHGRLHWEPAGASGQLQMDGPDLRLGDIDLPLSAGLVFSPRSLTLSALDLRQGELKGELWSAAAGGPWRGRLEADEAWLPAFDALLGHAHALSGTASGSISLGERGLQADLTLAQPWPRALPGASAALKLSAEGTRWTLGSLRLSQGEGRLDAAGSVDLSRGAAWTGQAHWQGLRLHGAAFEGQARLGAGGPDAGRLELGPWSLSGTALPALRADLTLKQGAWSELTVAVGPASHLTAHREGNAWKARLDLKGQDPALWAGPWTGHAGPSALRLDGWVEAEGGGGQPGAWQASLADAALPASRLSAEGALDGPAALRQARWKGWDLQRLREAAVSVGWSLPALQGNCEGEALAWAGGISLSAQADGLGFDGIALGHGELKAWRGSEAWSLEHLAAGGNGPQISASGWRAQQAGGVWKGSGRLHLDQWPAALFFVSTDAALKWSAGNGAGVLQAQCAPLKVSERKWDALGLRLQWDAAGFKLAEDAKRPAFTAEGRMADGRFELKRLSAESGGGKASLKGSVGPGHAMQFDGSAQGFPAGELTALLDWPMPWTGRAYGSLSLTGSVGGSHGIISVKIEDGSVSGLPFDLASGLIGLEPGWVQLSPLQPIRLSRRSGLLLEVSGKVPLGRDDGAPPSGLEVDAALKRGGLELLSGLPGIRSASGPLELSLRFRGRRDDPQVTGRLQVSDGKIEADALLPPLEKLEVFAQIEDGRLLLHTAQAQVQGQGPLLKLELADPTRPAFTFERWLPGDMNLRLRASRSGLDLRSTKALRFVDGTVHPDVVLGGSWASPSLSGEIRLERGGRDRAVLQWPPRFDPPRQDAQGFFSRVRYDLRLVARQDVMVRTEAAQVFVDSGAQGLRLLGQGADRELEGRLRFTQGSVDYLLASFQLATDKETYLDFRPGAPPELQLWGDKKVKDALLNGALARRDVDVTLHAYGPIGQIEMRLQSDDAGLTQQQLASLVGFGVDASDPRNAQGGFVKLIGKLPGSLLTRWLRASGVVDDVGVRLPAVEDALVGPRATPGPGEAGYGAQVTPVSNAARTLVEVNVGKYLGEKVYVGANVQFNQHPDAHGGSSVDPAVGGKVEYQWLDDTRVSAQHNVDTSGQSEQRLMVERSTQFENYNPRKRRWDQETAAAQRRGPPSPSATPSPSPSPTPSGPASTP